MRKKECYKDVLGDPIHDCDLALYAIKCSITENLILLLHNETAMNAHLYQQAALVEALDPTALTKVWVATVVVSVVTRLLEVLEADTVRHRHRLLAATPQEAVASEEASRTDSNHQPALEGSGVINSTLWQVNFHSSSHRAPCTEVVDLELLEVTIMVA